MIFLSISLTSLIFSALLVSYVSGEQHSIENSIKIAEMLQDDSSDV